MLTEDDTSRTEDVKENLSNWLTNISLVVLGFFVTQLVQIKLRIGINSEEKIEVLFSLASLTISSGAGLLNKLLVLVERAYNSSSQDFKTINPPRNQPIKLEDKNSESQPTESLSSENLTILQSNILPVLQVTFLFAGIANVVSFMMIFLFEITYKSVEVLEILLFMIIPLILYFLVLDKNALRRVVNNLGKIKIMISTRLKSARNDRS